MANRDIDHLLRLARDIDGFINDLNEKPPSAEALQEKIRKLAAIEGTTPLAFPLLSGQDRTVWSEMRESAAEALTDEATYHASWSNLLDGARDLQRRIGLALDAQEPTLSHGALRQLRAERSRLGV